MTSTSRGNVSIYTIIPGRTSMRGGGLVEFTGGVLAASTSDLRPAIQRLLQDANHYYLVGFWPQGKARALHDLEVKVARKDVKVIARRRRG
jgi:hypothetical protein